MILDNEILDKLNIGILIVDAQIRYVYMNQKELSGFLKAGYTREDCLSWTVNQLMEAGLFKDSAVLETFQTKRECLRIEVIYDVNSGLPLHQQLIRTTPVFDTDGNIKYVIGEIIKLEEIEYAKLHAKYSDVYVYPIPLQEQKAIQNVVAESPAMKNVLNLAKKVASTNVTVLLEGESGCGKEVVANYIYKTGEFPGELITVNCAAIPEQLLESELFGYVRGAFSGADIHGKKGMIEAAENGVLFLDEINSLPLLLQGKLLRVLESHMVQRIGSEKSIHVNFKLIAATNRNLNTMVKEGKFREDLFYRINVVPLCIPPLRERREDIIPLAKYFLQYFCQQYDKNKNISDVVCEMLRNYSWPGNVRELRNFIERIIITSADSVYQIDKVPVGMLDSGDEEKENAVANTFERSKAFTYEVTYNVNKTLKEYQIEYERWLIEQAVNNSSSLSEAAARLGIDKSTLIRKRNRR